jgi:hypothetical protein
VSDTPKTDPEKLTVKQLIGMATPAQLRALLVTLIALVCGVFTLGMWVNQVRLEHKFAQDLDAGVKSEVESKTSEFNSRLEAAKAETDAVRKEERRHTQQVEFLERCCGFLGASVKGKETLFNTTGPDVMLAKKQFVLMLQRMYHGGDVNLQKAEGYEFDESEPGNHHLIFEGGKSYRIPRDVKEDFVQKSWRSTN